MEETIGQRVRKERRAKGMSQGQLAREASLSLNAISALEQGGRVDPRSSTILSISRVLDVPVATLLLGEEAPKAVAPHSSDEVRRILELWAPFVDTANQEEVVTFTEAVMRCAQGDDRWAAETLVTMTSSASIQEMEEGRALKELAEPKERRDRGEELEEMIRRNSWLLAALRARTSKFVPTDLDERLLAALSEQVAALSARTSESVPTDKR